MELGLNGKTALVIASSQGLGKAIAKEFVLEGANVMLASRSADKLEKVQAELKNINPDVNVAFMVIDVKNDADIKALMNQTIDTFGRLDVLVNNAGGPPAGTFESLTDEDWQHSFELNLLSYIRMIRESLPYLRKNGGKIINIASSSIKEPIPGLILSNTFRLGIVGLTKTLSRELAADNIIINTVAPGRIATDRVAHLDKFNAEKMGISQEEVEANRKKEIPLGRYGEPSEFAKTVVFLASDVNTYMTGNSFLVDGGLVKSI